jgi:hypothetical protein
MEVKEGNDMGYYGDERYYKQVLKDMKNSIAYNVNCGMDVQSIFEWITVKKKVHGLPLELLEDFIEKLDIQECLGEVNGNKFSKKLTDKVKVVDPTDKKEFKKLDDDTLIVESIEKDNVQIRNVEDITEEIEDVFKGKSEKEIIVYEALCRVVRHHGRPVTINELMNNDNSFRTDGSYRGYLKPFEREGTVKRKKNGVFYYWPAVLTDKIDLTISDKLSFAETLAPRVIGYFTNYQKKPATLSQIKARLRVNKADTTIYHALEGMIEKGELFKGLKGHSNYYALSQECLDAYFKEEERKKNLEENACKWNGNFVNSKCEHIQVLQKDYASLKKSFESKRKNEEKLKADINELKQKYDILRGSNKKNAKFMAKVKESEGLLAEEKIKLEDTLKRSREKATEKINELEKEIKIKELIIEENENIMLDFSKENAELKKKLEEVPDKQLTQEYVKTLKEDLMNKRNEVESLKKSQNSLHGDIAKLCDIFQIEGVHHILEEKGKFLILMSRCINMGNIYFKGEPENCIEIYADNLKDMTSIYQNILDLGFDIEDEIDSSIPQYKLVCTEQMQ